MSLNKIEEISPENFEYQNHFYPKALNTQMHPLVNYFMGLNQEQIIGRYTHLNPSVDVDRLREILSYQTKHFFWGGSDLFYTTTEKGNRKMVVLETNSCPSGQKSMPMSHNEDEHRGYLKILKESFIPQLKKRRLPQGALAIIYDKNYMEVSGYASTLADITGEKVYLIEYNESTEDIYFKDGILHVNIGHEVIKIRAAFRYVTQRPWNRIPPHTRTFIFNSTLVCLAGGRNKLLAGKAYEIFNGELLNSGLYINLPETIKDVSKLEIPLWIKKFGGLGVIKNPYSNAGQGVYTITSEEELERFMDEEHPYNQFIVQTLIGHPNWTSQVGVKKLFHVGSLPDKKNRSYIFDIRFMVFSGEKGFAPCAIYGRKGQEKLTATIPENSWQVLGTNLSLKQENHWETDTKRLLLMDNKDFNLLGLGVDDLIEGYIQTVLSIIAIDKMSENLISSKGRFKIKLFKSLDNDKNLINEIYTEDK